MESPIDLFLKRRSIRKFTDQAVEPEKVDLLLKAAMAAPSAVNSRPWEFIVVDDPSRLAQLKAVLAYGKHNAPLAVVVCANQLIATNPAGWLFWLQDCAAATQSMLLAAVALGLGGVWIGVAPMAAQQRTVRKVLQIPVYVTPFCVVEVGYPAEEKPPRTQFEDRRVHHQVY